MRKIANILAEKTSINEPIYNIAHRKDELIEGIPTLVIGWEFTKSMYPEANIIEWKIDENTYWTFGNRERRSAYEERINRFFELAVGRINKALRYEFVNILSIDDEKRENFLSDINGSNGTYVYTYNNMCYMCIPDKMVVYGIYIKDLMYAGMDVKSFFRGLYGSEHAVQVSCESDDEKNIRSMFKNCNYIFPYMLSC